MVIVISIIFVVMFIWCLGSLWYSYSKRNHLTSYIIYLLVNDSIFKDHQAKFQDWIRTSNARNALELSTMASRVIDNMAEVLAKGGNSTLAAHTMLWSSGAASELRKKTIQTSENEHK